MANSVLSISVVIVMLNSHNQSRTVEQANEIWSQGVKGQTHLVGRLLMVCHVDGGNPSKPTIKR